ncbi:MAG: alpha amylase N-terminal ig-like domain-containing protein [Fusobacteriota bacterium]
MKKSILLIMVLFIVGCTNGNKPQNKVVKRPSSPAVGDSYIFKTRLGHEANKDYVVKNGEKEVRIFFDVRSNDIEKVNLNFKQKDKFEIFEMKKLGVSGLKEIYYINVDYDPSNNGIEYYFEIVDGDAKIYYGEQVVNDKMEVESLDYTFGKEDETRAPHWAKEVVWYQIFMDRFKNGNKENDPIYNEYGPQSFKKPTDKLESGTPKASLIPEERWNSFIDGWNAGQFTINEWTSNWHKDEPWEKKAREKHDWDDGNTRHYGGDIQGVIEKLDYIKDMGFTAIWFNPVFYAESNHKYDTADYRHIAPAFGVIEQTGNTYDVKVNSDNKYGNKIHSKKGDSEYKLLSYDINLGRNQLNETSDPSTWVWTESDLLMVKLIKEAHKRGIRIIFDGVFNHTGNEFWAFVQTLIEGPDSEYADWYTFHDWNEVEENKNDNIDEWNPGVEYSGKAEYGVFKKDGETYRRRWVETPKGATDEEKWEIFLWNKDNVEYESWWGYRSLPKLDHGNKKVGQHMIDISKKWMLGPDGEVSDDWKNDDGIDGFRLDVPLDIEDQTFWERWKKEIIDVKPDVYTSAEIWGEAREHIYEEKFDAAMNYQFAAHILEYLVNTGRRSKVEPTEYKAKQELLFSKYPDETAQIMQNLMDSHDTDRIYSMVINPDREYDRNNRVNENRSYKAMRPDLYDDDAVNNLKLVSLIQMTYVGAPMVYYGGEVGIWGADDPQDRKPMLWDEYEYNNETDTLEKYKEKDINFPESVEVNEANGEISYPVEINEDIKSWYKDLIQIRNENKELFSFGNTKYVLIDDEKDAIAYERTNEDKIILVVINNNEKKENLKVRVTEPGIYENLLDEKEYETFEGELEIDLDSKSGVLLKLKK